MHFSFKITVAVVLPAKPLSFQFQSQFMISFSSKLIYDRKILIIPISLPFTRRLLKRRALELEFYRNGSSTRKCLVQQFEFKHTIFSSSIYRPHHFIRIYDSCRSGSQVECSYLTTQMTCIRAVENNLVQQTTDHIIA